MNDLPDVSGSAPVVWAAIVVVILVGAGTATRSGLGPITAWWYEFAKRRREAAVERDDADLADLTRQVRGLSRRVEAQDRTIDQMRRREAQRDEILVEHHRWDIAAQREVNRLGGRLDPPPDLWPPLGH